MMTKKKSFQVQRHSYLSLATSKRKIFQVMFGISIALTFVSFLTSFAHFYLNDFPLRETFYGLFDVNSERSIPTLYSVYSIQFCAVILAIISLVVKQNSLRYYKHWYFLTFVFIYLSLDEYLSLHERMANPFSNINTWVIPVLFLVLVLFISYLRFLFHVPKKIRNIFIFSGSVYIFGAAGMEIIGYTILDNRFLYLLGSSLEEFMEMFGIALFAFALLAYLEKQLLTVELSFN